MLPLPDPDNVLGFFAFERLCSTGVKDWYFMDMCENFRSWELPEASQFAKLEAEMDKAGEAVATHRKAIWWAADNMPILAAHYFANLPRNQPGDFPYAD